MQMGWDGLLAEGMRKLSHMMGMVQNIIAKIGFQCGKPNKKTTMFIPSFMVILDMVYSVGFTTSISPRNLGISGRIWRIDTDRRAIVGHEGSSLLGKPP